MVKKQLLCSRRRAGHAHQGTGELNEDQTDRAQVIVNNANEVSSALIPQIPAVNSSRAGADTEDLQLMVRNPMNISDTVISLYDNNNNNNNKLYLHDHNKVLQYCKSYLKLIIDSL